MSDKDREPDALDRYLDDLRRDGPDGARIPVFDDADGRTDAVILFLFQDPSNSGAKLDGGTGCSRGRWGCRTPPNFR